MSCWVAATKVGEEPFLPDLGSSVTRGMRVCGAVGAGLCLDCEQRGLREVSHIPQGSCDFDISPILPDRNN